MQAHPQGGREATVAVGKLRVVALEGEEAPAGPGSHGRLNAASVDGSGRVAFCAAGAVVVVTAGGSSRQVVRAGDRAPRGGRYLAFGGLDVADGDLLAVAAGLEDGPASCGLFLLGPEGTSAVALAGDRAPRGGVYRSFHRPQVVAWPQDGGRRHRLSFVARLDDGRKSLVTWSPRTGAEAWLTTGDRLGEEVVDDLVTSDLAFGVCCVASLRRGRGTRCVRQAFVLHQGRAYTSGRLREGAELPPLGAVTRMLAPPAVNVQMGFVALRFDDGGAALCTVPPALVGPEVVVRSGDRLPGLPTEAVAGLGPPVANGGVSQAGPFGVASVARLREGRTALWLGVFAGQLPLRGEAMVPLLEGDRTDDDRALLVTGFQPVKLTDTGVLLLRARLGAGGAARRGLLVLDGLFDWCRS